MCNPWVVCQKKSVVQQYWELCLFWQPARPGFADSLSSCALLTVCPLCAEPSPSSTPHFLHVMRDYISMPVVFLKGTGYLRCRLYVWRSDSCSPGDGPSWSGCESAPLMAGLLVFSSVDQRLISCGGQQESLDCCSVFHLRKFEQGTDTWLSWGRASWLHQWADAWEVQSAHPCLIPWSVFPYLTSINLIIYYSILS